MSSLMDVGVRGGLAGTIRRRNFLFRRVARPEPSIRTTYILVKLLDLCYHAGSVPFERVMANLILDAHSVPDFQRRQAFSTGGPALLGFDVSHTQSLLPFIQCVLPGWVWLVTARENRNKVLKVLRYPCED